MKKLVASEWRKTYTEEWIKLVNECIATEVANPTSIDVLTKQRRNNSEYSTLKLHVTEQGIKHTDKLLKPHLLKRLKSDTAPVSLIFASLELLLELCVELENFDIISQNSVLVNNYSNQNMSTQSKSWLDSVDVIETYSRLKETIMKIDDVDEYIDTLPPIDLMSAAKLDEFFVTSSFTDYYEYLLEWVEDCGGNVNAD